MADPKLVGGYMGILTGPATVRCTSFSVNSSQDLLFYNPVYGINDALASGDTTKSETPGVRTLGLKRLFRPSVITVGGSFSYPATENTISTFFDKAKSGAYIEEMKFMYYCDGKEGVNGATFKQCRVNSFDLNAQAGEVVNISVDIGAKEMIAENASGGTTISEKLITWDKVKVTTVPNFVHIRGITFKINNNLSPIYTAGAKDSTSLFPSDLRLGIQELTGSISLYLKQGQVFIPTSKQTADSLSVVCTGINMKADVFYQTTQAEGTVGPAICEIPFIGVGNIFA